MSFGLTPEGFNRKTIADMIATLYPAWRGIFSDDVDLSADSPDAQILDAFIGELDEGWQTLEDIYDSMRPSKAVGTALSEIVGFNGIGRKLGSSTVVQGQLTISIASVYLPPTTIVETTSGDQFQIVLGGVFTNGNTATFTSVDKAAILVAPGELTKIVTPVSGWTSITNASAQLSIGSANESDGTLRSRQKVSTQNGASNILESLYSALLQVTGVLRSRVYVNATAATVDGRPAHSYEAVVEGGANAEVAAAIWSRHPSGIEMFGGESEVIVDSQGFNQTIEFTRPTAVDIVVNIVVAPTADYPSTGDDDIKQAILDYAEGLLVDGEEFGIGDDVLLSRLYSATNSVPGHNVTTLQIGDPTLGTADITIDEVERARFTIANITVTS